MGNETIICDLYKNGLTTKEIGTRINKSGEYVRKVLICNKIDRIPRSQRYKKCLDEIKIINEYKSGISPDIIANNHKVGETTVYRILKRHNIKCDRFNLNGYISESIQKEICEQYRNDCFTTFLSTKYHISKSSIIKILRQHGINVRSADISNKTFLTKRDYFEKIDSFIKAYILGLLFSDGCNSHGHISVALQKKDDYLLDFILDEIYISKKSKKYDREKYGVYCSSIDICDKKISSDLKKIGMIERKSLVLEYPYGIFSDVLFGHFLRGYFDGDGCIYFNKKSNAKSFIITGGSIEFLQSLKEEIEKRIEEKLPNVWSHKMGWHEIRTGKLLTLRKIYALMYPNDIGKYYMTRKKDKFMEAIQC